MYSVDRKDEIPENGMHMENPKRLIVGMTGASGAIYGVRLLKILRNVTDVETHLVVSDAADLTLRHETGLSVDDVASLADHVYDIGNMAAAIASGSFRNDGMIIVPCSMKTLSAIAHAYGDNLITRAADVVLKERRRLVLMVRETPLHLGHLKNMQSVTEMGGIVYPPVPAFYCKPQSVEEMVDQTLRRVLDLFGIADEGIIRWNGMV